MKSCRDRGVRFIPSTRNYERYKREPHSNPRGNLAMAKDIRDFLMSDPDSQALLAGTVVDSSTGKIESP